MELSSALAPAVDRGPSGWRGLGMVRMAVSGHPMNCAAGGAAHASVCGDQVGLKFERLVGRRSVRAARLDEGIPELGGGNQGKTTKVGLGQPDELRSS
jgi:hypothetical protein